VIDAIQPNTPRHRAQLASNPTGTDIAGNIEAILQEAAYRGISGDLTEVYEPSDLRLQGVSLGTGLHHDLGPT